MACVYGSVRTRPDIIPHQEMKNHIVLVMELCDYDLDKLVKTSPFKEDDITLFLYQLGEWAWLMLR